MLNSLYNIIVKHNNYVVNNVIVVAAQLMQLLHPIPEIMHDGTIFVCSHFYTDCHEHNSLYILLYMSLYT